jgi:hypothetical protein
LSCNKIKLKIKEEIKQNLKIKTEIDKKKIKINPLQVTGKKMSITGPRINKKQIKGPR